MDVTAIVMAAGEGTRMKSARPKVLHAIGGRSLLGHAIAAAQGLPAVQSLSASQVGGSNKPGGGLDLELAPM